MKSRFLWSCLAGFTLLVSGLILTGCAYNRVHLGGGKTYDIERIRSSPIYISWVYAEEENSEMIITGLLRSHFSSSQGTGHVDVAVISPGGELLGQTSTDFAPKTIPSRSRRGGSRFEAHFPFLPPDGARIRLALHDYPELKKGNSDCGYNLAARGGEI